MGIYKIIFNIAGVCIILSVTIYASPKETKVSNGIDVNIATNHNNKTKMVLPYKKGEVVVKYKNAAVLKTAKNTSVSFRKYSAIKRIKSFKNAVGEKKHYMLIQSKSLNTKQLIEEFKNDPDVEYVGPNYIYYPDETAPDDAYFNKQWAQENTGQTLNGTAGTPGADIDATKAWDKTTGSPNVVIAVTGFGVNYLHEDLKNNMWKNNAETPNDGIDNDGNGYIDDIYGINAAADSNISGEGNPMDLNGHGTHVAGIIAAEGDNGKGMAGNSWKSKIMALKFFANGTGTTSSAIECLEYILDQKNKGVNIVAVNASWGSYSYDQLLKNTIEELKNKGILLIASAGNDKKNNDSTPRYPASYDSSNIISVAATNQKDEFDSDYSNYGVTTVDLAAPGTNIYSTVVKIDHNIFFDDMEDGLAKWETGGDHNWAISENQESLANSDHPVPSGTHFLSDSPGASYPSNASWWVGLKNNINLASKGNVFITFNSAIYLSQNSDGSISDYAYLELSKDGGQTWRPVFNYGVYSRYWSGPYIIEIPKEFKTSQFRLRFRMDSTANDGKPGWLIDDVAIGTMENNVYGFKTGTSMAAPQVTGAIALASSECPGEDISVTKNRILNTVDTHATLGWKVSSGGRLNLNRLLNSNCNEMIENEQAKKYPSLNPIYYLLFN